MESNTKSVQKREWQENDQKCALISLLEKHGQGLVAIETWRDHFIAEGEK